MNTEKLITAELVNLSKESHQILRECAERIDDFVNRDDVPYGCQAYVKLRIISSQILNMCLDFDSSDFVDTFHI